MVYDSSMIRWYSVVVRVRTSEDPAWRTLRIKSISRAHLFEMSDQRDHLKLSMFRNHIPPSKVYHQCSFFFFVEILRTSMFWVCSVTLLNNILIENNVYTKDTSTDNFFLLNRFDRLNIINIFFRLDGVPHGWSGRYASADLQILQGNHRDHRRWPIQVPYGYRDQYDHPLHEEDEAQRRGHIQDRREQHPWRGLCRDAALRFR